MTALETKLRAKFPNAPDSFFRRQLADAIAMRAPQVVAGKRIRQDDKPLMNKLEGQWFEILSAQFPNKSIRPQAKRYKLANGAWYKPDLTCSNFRLDSEIMETAWECKGPSCMKNVARGLLTIKFAAAQWPEVAFFLVWKDKGEWKQQRVLP